MTPKGILLYANETWGALHGLTSLIQLLWRVPNSHQVRQFIPSLLSICNSAFQFQCHVYMYMYFNTVLLEISAVFSSFKQFQVAPTQFLESWNTVLLEDKSIHSYCSFTIRCPVIDHTSSQWYKHSLKLTWLLFLFALFYVLDACVQWKNRDPWLLGPIELGKTVKVSDTARRKVSVDLSDVVTNQARVNCRLWLMEIQSRPVDSPSACPDHCPVPYWGGFRCSLFNTYFSHFLSQCKFGISP